MIKLNLDKITTEQRNENTLNIDKASSLEIVELINSEDKKIASLIEEQKEDLSKAIDLSVEVVKNGGRIFYLGAGSSGRIGVLDASEMGPTYNVSNDLVIGVIAGGEYALRNPIEGAEDDEEQAQKDLMQHNFNEKDILIGIAASGRTPYVIGGLNYAKSIGAKTAAISSSSGSKMSKITDISINIVTGPEPIMGSTRMKSGTAQKMTLNILSTGIMIKLGKVYSNLMVDIKVSNKKLAQRAVNITKKITNADEDLIVQKLEESDYSPKLASIMIIKKVSLEDAKKLLQDNEGILRRVID